MSKVQKVISELSGDCVFQQRAHPDALATLRQDCEFELPSEYLDFLSLSNGGFGALGTQPGGYELWNCEEVLEQSECYLKDWLPPKFLAFGTSGGGELFVFDFRNHGRCPVCIAPSIGMEEDLVVEIAEDFLEFVFLMGKKWVISDDPNEPFNVKAIFDRTAL